jgi:signal transduction histidine kinase
VTWAQIVISSAGCAGQLAVALVALRRSAQSALALPVALLFLDIFAWNLAALLFELSGHRLWALLDHSLSPLTPPLALNVALAFVGETRRFRRLRIAAFVPFLALSAMPEARFWAAALAILAVPVMAFALFRLALHLARSGDAHERARTRLLLAAFALGTALGLTDLLGNYIERLPSLGALGFLAAGALTLVGATREKLLDVQLPLASAAAALALAVLGVVAYLALFRLASAEAALLVLGTAVVTLVLAAVFLQVGQRASAQRVRTRELATLGRFASQMAHDLKNPLAALKGAAQFLEEDLRPEDRGKPRASMVRVLLEQSARMEAAIDGYQRLSRIEPRRAELKLEPILREAVSAASVAAGDRIAVSAEVQELPRISLDGDLISTAVHNLVRNAVEAIAPRAGKVTVRCARADSTVLLSVEDDGPGMDARTRERAFDDFFTTKATGTGLGLPFVRRVVEAHGGTVTIESEHGRGTVVRIRLPLG